MLPNGLRTQQYYPIPSRSGSTPGYYRMSARGLVSISCPPRPRCTCTYLRVPTYIGTLFLGERGTDRQWNLSQELSPILLVLCQRLSMYGPTYSAAELVSRPSLPLSEFRGLARRSSASKYALFTPPPPLPPPPLVIQSSRPRILEGSGFLTPTDRRRERCSPGARGGIGPSFHHGRADM